MMRTVCKSKIHGARVTQTELEYEGSVTIPVDIIRDARLVLYEKVQIVNLNNGSRIETYVIPGKKGSGVICLNGPAARTAVVGDKVHIISYANVSDDELKNFTMKTVKMDRDNRIVGSKELKIVGGPA